MIVISMTSCPMKIRGDLSKWLMEINTGVYVGQVNTRVRESLWKRVCENIADGQATMVYSTNNEQHMEFRVHNTDWKPVDYDGLTLMRHPEHSRHIEENNDIQSGYSNAAKYQKGRRQKRKNLFVNADYVIVDLETTGLQPEKDFIIEIGALRVINGKAEDEFQVFVNINELLPKDIVKLTGITDEMLQEKGVSFQKAIHDMSEFVSDMNVVIYNASFDCAFLENAYRKYRISMMENHIVDALAFVRRRLRGFEDYKLATVAGYLDIKIVEQHRALSDCHLLYDVLSKLNEN